MSIDEMIQYIGQDDNAERRTCGNCGKQKPIEAFYKDGKYRDGTTRYRRDCKECYKATRIMDARTKNRRSK